MVVVMLMCVPVFTFLISLVLISYLENRGGVVIDCRALLIFTPGGCMGNLTDPYFLDSGRVLA